MESCCVPRIWPTTSGSRRIIPCGNWLTQKGSLTKFPVICPLALRIPETNSRKLFGNPFLARHLASFHFRSTLESGYFVRAHLHHNKHERAIQPIFKFKGEGTLDRLHITIPSRETRSYIECSPYICREGKLRIWDLNQTCDLTMGESSRSHVRVDGLPAEDVRVRCPKLFAIAQKQGHWL